MNSFARRAVLAVPESERVDVLPTACGRVTARVAVFIPSLRGGGAERAMLLFAEGLAAKGYPVDLIVAHRTGPLLAEVPEGVRLIDFAARKVSHSLLKLIRYLVRERPAALFSTIVNANIVAVIAAQWARRVHGVRCHVVVRESNVVSPKGPLTFARRISGRIAPALYRTADAVIAVSQDVAKELRTASPDLVARLHILPNPVVSPRIFELSNEATTHPWLEVRTGANSTALPLIVAAGRLHPQKDFPTLIKAFEILRERSPMRLIILGEGEQRAPLEALIAERKLQESVSLPGFASNPYPYFRRANVFVLSSLYEGMPNVLLQALAFGTPVVATRCHSGAQEVLTDAAFGRLVEPGNSAAMADAIHECLQMPRSAEASEFVARNFSVTHATDEYLRAAGLL